MSRISASAMHSARRAESRASLHATRLEDRASGYQLLVARPADEPHVWRSYLAGARAVYASWGVPHALDFDTVVSGESTRTYLAAMAEGRCVGGVRVQGPYRSVTDSHALSEWEEPSGREALSRAINDRVPYGVVEVKTAWVDPEFEGGPGVARLLGCVAPLILAESSCRFLLATSAEHSLQSWQGGGGRLDLTVPPAAYPDERYSTRLLWWDSSSVFDDAQPECVQVMTDLLAQYERAVVGSGTPEFSPVGTELLGHSRSGPSQRE